MVNHYDWKIHKILDEARTVYICPARGNSKLYTQLELYVELMTQNKTVKVIRSEDVKKDIKRLSSVPDFDLEFMLENQAKYEMFADYIHENWRDCSFKFVDCFPCYL